MFKNLNKVLNIVLKGRRSINLKVVLSLGLQIEKALPDKGSKVVLYCTNLKKVQVQAKRRSLVQLTGTKSSTLRLT